LEAGGPWCDALVEQLDFIEISPRVNEKINSRHGVSSLDVEDASVNVEYSRWDTNDQGQRRLFVVGRCGAGRRIMLVLFPRNGQPGWWNLATAFPIP
jgi:hypothetical protein